MSTFEQFFSGAVEVFFSGQYGSAPPP